MSKKNKKTLLAVFRSLTFVLLCGAVVAAADTAPALFALDAGHRVAMTAPPGWKWHGAPAGKSMMDVEMLPADEKGFNARLAIAVNEKPLSLEGSLPVSRGLVERARQRVAAASDIPVVVREIRSDRIAVYYYEASDRNWKSDADGFKHVLQGVAGNGVFTINFSFFSSGSPEDINRFLDMLKSATLVGGR